MNFRVSAWAIRNPLPVALLFIALTFVGLLAYVSLPIKQYPNISLPLISVAVTQRGAAPAEMESQITRPVENAIAGIANVKHINSQVTLGVSSTAIEFELGTDMQKAIDDVRTAVERVRVNLPTGIDPPSVTRVDIDSAPILTYAVSSPKMSTADLSWFVEDTVARAIQAQPGVAQVLRVGGIDREINVTLQADRMAALGVTAPLINAALSQFNTDETGGRAGIGAREQSVRVLGSAPTVDAIRQVTIPVNGSYVKLSDVAEVGDGSAEVRAFALLDGRPAVAFQVNKTKEASDVSTEKVTLAAIDKLAKAHPEVKFTEVLSTVEETRLTYENTVHVLLEGMVLAALVVLLFLRNWRATAIAATAMPLSLIPTFAFVALLGFSLNSITLLALTLVIGILVDDAIVEIENIEKRIERGATPYRASLVGADAIGLAVIATTTTIVVVFTPVSFMSGIVGQFFKEFGLTVAVAVILSLIVARLLTPVLSAYFLKPTAHPRPRKPLGGFYRKVLDWALDHPWLSTGAGALVFVASIALAATLPSGFQPTPNPGFFYLNMEGPPGSTREDMERAVLKTTDMLRTHPEVIRVFAQVGSGVSSGFDSGGSSDLRDGTITVLLDPKRPMTTDAFMSIIRPHLRDIPDVRITTLSGWGSNAMEIVLASEDGPVLEKAQLQLQREMRGLKLISDVRTAPPPPSPELVLRPKPDQMARLGVTSQALANVTRVATIGEIDAGSAKYSEGKRRIPIRVRLPEAARNDLSTLENLQVPTASGKTTPLANLADLSFQAGPGKIVRYGRERRASVLADRALGVSFGEAQKAINKLPILQKLPAGVHQAEIGDAEQYQELMVGFVIAMGSGIALIYAVLVLLFGSFFKPITIMSALPLSTMGAFLAIHLMGMELDLPVLIGLLMLLGLAAKNSILLVEFAITEERAGRTARQALLSACRERARPIVMTTVAMAAGMMPTALGLGRGSEFSQPMAVAVIGGLITSTALSLVLVPVVYEIVDRFEIWLLPKFSRFATPKSPGDDAPLGEDEDRPALTD